MTDETVLIDNLPDVSDINVMLDAISEIGAMVQRIDRHTVRINASTVQNVSIDYDSMKKSEVLTIFWELYSESITEQRSLFREDVISEADRLTSI